MVFLSLRPRKMCACPIVTGEPPGEAHARRIQHPCGAWRNECLGWCSSRRPVAGVTRLVKSAMRRVVTSGGHARRMIPGEAGHRGTAWITAPLSSQTNTSRNSNTCAASPRAAPARRCSRTIPGQLRASSGPVPGFFQDLSGLIGRDEAAAGRRRWPSGRRASRFDRPKPGGLYFPGIDATMRVSLLSHHTTDAGAPCDGGRSGKDSRTTE